MLTFDTLEKLSRSQEFVSVSLYFCFHFNARGTLLDSFRNKTVKPYKANFLYSVFSMLSFFVVYGLPIHI